jgi:dinuclear metal center YbgI/SA1388 family protein
MIKIESILNFFEKHLVSSYRQYNWDNSGKQIYIKNSKIRKIGFALDPSSNVINQAIEKGCELLITHHPLFFNEIKNISTDSVLGQKVVTAIKSSLNIVSYHTSMDLADYSLNDYVADLLGVKTKDIFIKEGQDKYFKFVVFVPLTHKDKILNAIEKVDAGHIGNYAVCTFSSEGEGTFLPLENTNPFIGKEGELEKVKEVKIETIVEKNKLSSLIKEVIDAHPYEEVAYDVYSLEKSKDYGLGKICTLDKELELDDFLKLISEKLDIKNLRYNFNNTDIRIKEFAIVTGSGASLWNYCVKKGINCLLTADMKHHDALDAMENGVIIIDAGHFETERIFMKHLADIIKNEFNIETIIIDEENTIKQWGL